MSLVRSCQAADMRVGFCWDAALGICQNVSKPFQTILKISRTIHVPCNHFLSCLTPPALIYLLWGPAANQVRNCLSTVSPGQLTSVMWTFSASWFRNIDVGSTVPLEFSWLPALLALNTLLLPRSLGTLDLLQKYYLDFFPKQFQSVSSFSEKNLSHWNTKKPALNRRGLIK